MPSGYETIPSGDEQQGSAFFKRTCALCTIIFIVTFKYLAGVTTDAVSAAGSAEKSIAPPDVADSGEPWPSHFIKLGMLYQPMDTTEAKEKGWKRAAKTASRLLVNRGFAGATSDAVSTEAADAPPDLDGSGEPWPSHFIKLGMLYQPMNTAEAKEQGWKPSGEDCVPSLGEPWIYGDERSANTSSTFFYTPAVGDVPGVLSGIEVDYYDYHEEKLIAEFFSEERTSKDGSYYSIALALRDSSKQDLCDTTSTIAYPNEEYLAIDPDKANKLIPLSESSTDLTENYKEGACLPGMGNHWETDIVGGKD
eukprot:CAMPEP_0201135530 /NCGR_PEP_ID=MMETSP0850-20130426/54366_1 /ASSEMBLY_ACC=CAM_ASM_000622 /TAXON_ID=183588 /ORGANISM="Pseudo-nitzschia fraudulenta, Strain WWA7" /LENGTH=307 /DNA_ID=CAMNT_0047406703 /DNA_START=314 /DNA_END=1235 /DNA_ORIENTATION=-